MINFVRVSVAQGIEHLPSKQRVVGPNPTRDTSLYKKEDLMDLIKILWHALSGYMVLTISIGIGLILFFGGLVFLFDRIWVGLLMILGGLTFAALGAKLGLKMGAGR